MRTRLFPLLICLVILASICFFSSDVKAGTHVETYKWVGKHGGPLSFVIILHNDNWLGGAVSAKLYTNWTWVDLSRKGDNHECKDPGCYVGTYSLKPGEKLDVTLFTVPEFLGEVTANVSVYWVPSDKPDCETCGKQWRGIKKSPY
jgi:hypothetical protein